MVRWVRRSGGSADPATMAAAVAAVAAVAPILVAAGRGARRGWTPTGDDAASAIRAHDVFTGNVPLLGTWSSASNYTGHLISHPGPLQFDLLAVPVRLLGLDAGTAVGTALVNATAVGLLGWLVHRRAGAAAATVAFGLSACLAWSLGSEMLYDPWSQYAPLLPFALFVVAVWCAAAGDVVAAPVAAAAGSYALQTHLSYSLLVPGLALFGLVAAGGRLLAARRRGDPEAWVALRARARRWGGVTVAVGTVCWLQPLVEEVTAEGEGNLTALARSVSAEAPTPGLGRAVRAVGGTLAVPPAWLPPSYGSPSFRLDGSGVPTVLAVLGLGALAAAAGVLGARAWRRGSATVAAGAGTVIAALVLALLTGLRAPIRYGMAPTYFRWMWPLGMVLWLILAVAVLDEIRSRRPGHPVEGEGADPGGGPGPDPGPRWAWAPGLVVALVAGGFALPTVDNGAASPPWAIEGAHALEHPVVEAVLGEPGVVVEVSPDVAAVAIGPALETALVEAGVPFYVEDPIAVRQLGDDRALTPGDATVRLRIVGRHLASPRPGEDEVATFDALSTAEHRELDRLEARVVDLVEEHGLPLIDDAARVFAETDRPHKAEEVEEAAAEPQDAVDRGLVRDLWKGGLAGWAGRPLLDTDVFPPSLMDRWAELQGIRDESALVVYRSPA